MAVKFPDISMFSIQVVTLTFLLLLPATLVLSVQLKQL